MNIRVCVFMNESAKNSNVRAFENIVAWNDDIKFPYSHFIDVMKVCFGSKSIVTFEVC